MWWIELRSVYHFSLCPYSLNFTEDVKSSLENRCAVHKWQGCFSKILRHEPHRLDIFATEHKTKGEGSLCSVGILGVPEAQPQCERGHLAGGNSSTWWSRCVHKCTCDITWDFMQHLKSHVGSWPSEKWIISANAIPLTPTDDERLGKVLLLFKNSLCPLSFWSFL